MISKAVILLPPRSDGHTDAGRTDPLMNVCGLTLIQRMLYSAQWAGIDEGVVLSHDDRPDLEEQVERDPGNRAFSWLAVGPSCGDAPVSKRLKRILAGDFLLLTPGWIVDRRVLRDFCGAEPSLDHPILVNPAGPCGRALPPLALVPGKSSPALAEAIREWAPLEELVRRLAESPGMQEKALSEPELIKVRGPEDRAKAERLLFQGLIKPTESFLSRKFERRISLAITARLLHPSITPNQISIVSILIGLAGGLLFLPGHRALHVLGALLLLFSSIVDGCDGEIARLKFKESKWGSWLDFLGDNLVHITVFFCIGLGLYRQGAGALYMALGGLAALATFGSAAAVFFRVFLKSGSSVITFATPVRGGEMDGADEKLRRQAEIADKISNRDFIYLVVFLAAVGKLWIWAWVCAVGNVFYFLYLVFLYRRLAAIRRASPGSGS
ncbi:CDP-alcohol phosphatidyltransferase family protein [Thermodesulfobacteriota bacterium]